MMADYGLLALKWAGIATAATSALVVLFFLGCIAWDCWCNRESAKAWSAPPKARKRPRRR